MAKNREEFIARQIEYTKKRELAHIAKSIKDDETYKKELIKVYKRTQDRIEKEIAAQYLRFANKEGLTMDEAMLRISKFDADAFSKKAAELVKKADLSQEANDLLRQYNLKMRVSRLELMKREMLLETAALADKEVKMLNAKLIEEVQKEAERQASILKLSKETRKAIVKSAERIVRTNMYSATFSQRIWANQTQLINRLAEGLERSILQGENPTVWASNLRDLVTKEMADTGKENALYAANRIAVTETARVQSETALESFRKGGFEKMIWITEMDERTCDVCGPLDGEIFDVDGAQIGGELPPVHPFCRCSVAAYYERES